MTPISGNWNGYYSQHGTRHRIQAKLESCGNQLSGTMVDLDYDTSQSLYDAVAHLGLPPGSDEQIAEEIHELLVDEPHGPITSRSILPQQSSVTGRIDGEFVRFTKSYQGDSWHGYVMGSQVVEETHSCPDVEYSGRISSTRNSIEGEWAIFAEDDRGSYQSGTFKLIKEATEPCH